MISFSRSMNRSIPFHQIHVGTIQFPSHDPAGNVLQRIDGNGQAANILRSSGAGGDTVAYIL